MSDVSYLLSLENKQLSQDPAGLAKAMQWSEEEMITFAEDTQHVILLLKQLAIGERG